MSLKEALVLTPPPLQVRALVATRGQRNCLKLMGVLESPQELTLLVDNVDGGDVLQVCNVQETRE